jgi:uncharacterized membrane protein YGL010W
LIIAGVLLVYPRASTRLHRGGDDRHHGRPAEAARRPHRAGSEVIVPDSRRATSAADPSTRRVDRLLERYGEFHRNRANKAIHWVCVPLIVWSVLGALWTVSPVAACVVIVLTMAFYLRLSLPLAVGMLGVIALMVWPLSLLGSRALMVSIAVFVVAWVGQFIGHVLEGRKPAFLEDVRSLLIGPVWLLADLYRRLGIAY